SPESLAPLYRAVNSFFQTALNHEGKKSSDSISCSCRIDMLGNRDGDEPGLLAKLLETLLSSKKAYPWSLRARKPRMPRGKNSTTKTKRNPMKDIQFVVMLEI